MKCPNCGFEQIVGELTPREVEVVELLCEGLSNKEIAHDLNIEVRTVKNHLSNACVRLNVKNRVSLAVIYSRDKYKKEAIQIDNLVGECTSVSFTKQ